MSSANYLATEIARGYDSGGYENGGLPYWVLKEGTYWHKYKAEVDELLRQMGYEFLIVDKIEGLK